MKLVPTASSTVGPFFHYALDRPEWSDLTGGGKARGGRIALEGTVTDGDGAPVEDVLVEIWQANAAGRYDHPEDTQEKPLDPSFRGFGRAATDKAGTYRFATVRPGSVPGRGNALQAPHVVVTVFGRGLLKQLVTRIYFEGEAANETDPVLSSIDDPARRSTLLAKRTPAGYRFDIRLQGEGETVFFEL